MARTTTRTRKHRAAVAAGVLVALIGIGAGTAGSAAAYYNPKAVCDMQSMPSRPKPVC
ncbi:hypothetical protein [Kitasatospora sp. NPDC088351]|uniref:hypothetical protein n=1 Tax=unclassified Kitasatospora TaxID=2633591 RepID=UPI0034274F22